MKKAIGANVKLKQIDETFHPEHEVETWMGYISFSDVPDFDLCTGNELDDFGVRDSEIFTYMEYGEKELQDYMDYPEESYAILDYDLVYSKEEISTLRHKHAVI